MQGKAELKAKGQALPQAGVHQWTLKKRGLIGREKAKQATNESSMGQ